MSGDLRGDEADRGIGIGLAKQFLSFEAVGRRIGEAVEADGAGSQKISLFGKLSRVKSGEEISLDGQGFMYDEEGLVQDHWSFNGADCPAFIYLDNCAEFYCQKIWFED